MGVRITGDDKVRVMLQNMSSGLRPKASKALMGYAFSVLATVQVKSPVDEGRFKAAWNVRPTVTPGSLTAAVISNPLPYASALEKGSPRGQKPWPNPGPKTVLYHGRIYSKQAPGGILGPMLPGMASEAAKAINKEVLG